jgi:putative heme-binding domain-containing protein
MTRYCLAALAVLLLVDLPASAQTWQQRLKSEMPEALAREALEKGDAARGAIVFFGQAMACSKCHVHDAPAALAPDLTKPEKETTDAYLAESILEPSKKIRAGFEVLTVTTADGRTVQGLLVEENDKQLVLREAAPGGKLIKIEKKEIEGRSQAALSAMPAGQVEQLTSRQEFLDLVRYLSELRTGGAKRAAELQPDPSLIAAAPLPEYESHLDHAKLIRGWNKESFARGEAIYNRVCKNCHGTREEPGSLPTSLKFADGKFKNGSDPFSMYQTLTRGFGFMVPQHWMVPRQKYDVIYYIREAYLKPHNPTQYSPLTDAWLASLPKGDTLGPAPSNIEPWVAMNYGPSLINTYEISPGNLAFKAIAMRLDSGAGGVSRGRNWLAFDHDTFRMAGAWEGSGFINWRGIHFNGEHQIHPQIAGNLIASNPVGPGWANPANGSLDDPRPKARDGRPYGPLPREWAKYRGIYAHGDRTIISYTIGETPVLESPELIEVPLDKQASASVYARHFELGPRAKPLTLVVATEPNAAQRGAVAGAKAVDSAAPVAAQETKGATDGFAFRGKQRIEIAKPQDFDLTRDYTILARIKTKEDGSIFAQAMADGDWVPDGKALFLRQGKLAFDMGWVGVVAGRTKVSDDKWHVVAMTWKADDASVRLYVDGKLDGQGKLKPKTFKNDFAIRLGFAAPDFPHPTALTGEMSAAAFVPEALADKAIAEVNQAGDLLKLPAKPLAAWNLREGKEGIFADLSGNKHDGKLHGEATSSAPRGQLVAGITPEIAGATWQWDAAGRLLLHLPAGKEKLNYTVWFAAPSSAKETLATISDSIVARPRFDFDKLMHGGPRRWPQTLTTTARIGESKGPFAIDVLTPPDTNPWLAQLRLTGLDFLDNDRAAVCAWDCDVWLVSGLSRLDGQTATPQLTWQRIASGLFQPLGIKYLHNKLYVSCRDQIVILNDLNGDGETDYYECFNNDHQVTEHFHEFAMGLQADAEGNLYYAKSARHALTALVPHHGTLLRVSADGSRTDILANGFRAANGVCLNPDGSFIVTDQEGHWNPKNRINWVTVDKNGPPKFYGNMFGYHDRTDSSDSAMEQPLCWITNAFDRSPAELLWVTSDQWGPLKGSLLNLSYGYGKVFVVPHEKVAGQMQGGMIELPIPAFPTGVMRGRFHPQDGQLYLCGMFAWAGSATQPGGFYRLRYTGEPVPLPVELHAKKSGMTLKFAARLDRTSATDAKNYSVKVWSLKRSANYGSPHIDEHALAVTKATLADDGRTLSLAIDGLAPTWCMEIQYTLRDAAGKPVNGKIHNTIHHLATP